MQANVVAPKVRHFVTARPGAFDPRPIASPYPTSSPSGARTLAGRTERGEENQARRIVGRAKARSTQRIHGEAPVMHAAANQQPIIDMNSQQAAVTIGRQSR